LTSETLALAVISWAGSGSRASTAYYAAFAAAVDSGRLAARTGV
jgi:hypothetical protein